MFLILPLAWLRAWLLARHDWPGKSIVETRQGVAATQVMPPVATGLILLKNFRRTRRGGWIFLSAFRYRHRVYVARCFDCARGDVHFPQLLVRSTRVAFEQVNPRLEQIARTLGASNSRVFWTIDKLPLASARRGDWRDAASCVRAGAG